MENNLEWQPGDPDPKGSTDMVHIHFLHISGGKQLDTTGYKSIAYIIKTNQERMS